MHMTLFVLKIVKHVGNNVLHVFSYNPGIQVFIFKENELIFMFFFHRIKTKDN